MKFRIKHILIATVVVAVFAYGLSFPDYYVERWFRFGAWVAATLLIVRPISRPADRRAVACGFIASGSYLAVLNFYDQPTPLPTTAALEKFYPRHVPAGASAPPGTPVGAYMRNPKAAEFRTIGEYGFATIFGLIAAGLAVYWSKESTNSQEPML